MRGDGAVEFARAILAGESALEQPFACRVGELELHTAGREQRLEHAELLVENAACHVEGHLTEDDGARQTIEKFGLEELFHLGEHGIARRDVAGKSHTGLARKLRSGVGGENQQHMTEIGLASVGVSERGAIHDLEQDVENVGMRLFDLIEQQHAVGRAADGVGELSAVLVAHVAGGRTDEARHGVFLGILAHVEVHQLNAQLLGEHFGHFGLAHAGGADEKERGHGLVGRGETGVRHHHGFGDLGDGAILPEDAAKQFGAEVAQGGVVVVVVGAEDIDLAEGGQHAVDEVARHELRAVGMHLAVGGGFVDEVDGFVGESAVVDVAIGAAHGVFDDAFGKGDVVKRFVACAQSFEDEAGLFDRGLGHVDGLETAHECAAF